LARVGFCPLSVDSIYAEKKGPKNLNVTLLIIAREKMIKKVLLSAVLSSTLVACGGGGSSSGPDSTPAAVERNVALAANGATVTATYYEDGAGLVIDGDTAESTFWSANITGDSLTIDIGSVVSLSDITIYTNDTSFSSSNPTKVFEISSEGNNWLKVAQITGGDIPCLSLSTGSGRILCEFTEPVHARYIRATITSATSPGLIQIHEIEATGI
jgi:hypothetical protein